MRKTIGKGTKELDWKQIGLGTGVGVIAMLTMTGLGAWLLERELVGLEWTNYLAALNLLVSSFVGGKTAGTSPERWPGPMMTGIGMWAVLLLIHLAGFGGQPEGAGATALAILGGTGASILLGGGGKRRKVRTRRYRNR